MKRKLDKEEKLFIQHHQGVDDMASKIPWTDETWNPVVGCTKCSLGCENCYAEKMAARLVAMKHDKYIEVMDRIDWLHWSGKIYCDEKSLDKPLHWRKPRKIFVCSMSDLFHPKVPFEFIDKVMAVISLCPQHTFQCLSKRADKMMEYFTEDVGHGFNRDTFIEGQAHKILSEKYNQSFEEYEQHAVHFPLKNLHLGVTVCTPDEKPKIDILKQIPAAIKFISFEPLLVDMGELNLEGIDWVILGGESGSKARPMHPDWARGIRDQCQAAGVPFFFKQWGEWLPGEVQDNASYRMCNTLEMGSHPPLPSDFNRTYSFDSDDRFSGKVRAWRVGKKKAGCLLDDREWKEYPHV